MSTAQRYVLVQFLLFAILVACMTFLPAEPASPLKLVGIAMVVMGVGVFVASLVAHNQTNNNLPKVSPTPNDKAQLVRSGVYGFIRHPIYTAVLFITLGASLYHGALPNYGVWLVLVVFFWQKSLFEEKMLKKLYPQYTAYMRDTGRFLPLAKRVLGGI